MGQYYKAILYTDHGNPVKGWLSPRDNGSGIKLMEHSWLPNDFVCAVEKLLIESGPWYKKQIVWAGDYAEYEYGMNDNLYQLAKDKLKIVSEEKIDSRSFPFIVNHSKKIYVDKSRVPMCEGVMGGWKIHPLPLLTCEGCGNGGGDFYGKDPNKLIGSWARNIISVESVRPTEFTEIIFDLIEK